MKVIKVLGHVVILGLGLAYCYRSGSITGCWFNREKQVWEPAPIAFGNIITGGSVRARKRSDT